MPITIARDFPTSSYNVNGTLSSTDTYVLAGDVGVHLRPARTFENAWMTWAAKLQGVTGLTPEVRVNAADRWVSATASQNEPVGLAYWSYALDGDDWRHFDNVSVVGSEWRFTNDAPWTQEPVFVAHQPLVPWDRVTRKVAEWTSHPHVRQAVGADASHVLTTLAATTDAMGRPVPALPLYGWVLENPAVAGPKSEHLLMLRQHPGEHFGAIAGEAACDFLHSEDPDAQWLRDRCRFFIVPCANPAGLYAGYDRNDPREPAEDHNRAWRDTDAGVPGEQPLLPTVAALMDAIVANVPNARGCMDWHNMSSCTTSRTPGAKFWTVFANAPLNDEVIAATEALLVGDTFDLYAPSGSVDPATNTGGTGYVQRRCGHAIVYTATYEEYPARSRPPAAMRALGAATVRALRAPIEAGQLTPYQPPVSIVHQYETRATDADAWVPLCPDSPGTAVAVRGLPEGPRQIRVRPTDGVTPGNWATVSFTIAAGAARPPRRQRGRRVVARVLSAGR